MLTDQSEYFYLDLKPETFVDSKGQRHSGNAVKKQGTKKCFVEEDLYTTIIDAIESKEIEKYFFGDIDRQGQLAVKYFEEFNYPMKDYRNYLDEILTYMSTQKLRTPKGLAWVSNQVRNSEKNRILSSMLRFTNMYSAIWAEAVWQIADASNSETKFIVSDHPVTVYNRECGPRSMWCRGVDDPDIWRQGTHTIFPLSIDKVLILTNLSWVRNPYQSATKPRPNSRAFGNAIFKFKDIQILRYLTENEVLEMNFVIKSRANQFIAAAKKEWLYPEKQVSKSDWNKFGQGYLFMPDPRPIHGGGEIIVGHRDGRASKFDEYGRRPWNSEFSKETKQGDEFKSLYRFKGEFASLFGPLRRGRIIDHNGLEKERDSDDYHNYHLSLVKQKFKERNS
jgi:hypothetical protein